VGDRLVWELMNEMSLKSRMVRKSYKKPTTTTDTPQKPNLMKKALMSRLWTDFFGTESCRTPKVFQNPDFNLKRRDFWVFL
ncbi:hypothetical protein J6K93_10665, partial [Leuconostoc mesenteroides]|nr:hypothetical protein [Leuconostoc mesenteroides]